MALTRVAPAGIGSTPGTGYVIGDSFLHATGLNATNGHFTGIVTAQTFRVIGDFQVDGTTTTLDTVLTEVDKLEVGANNNTVGVAITQSGTGDILRLYDGTTQAFTVEDGGNVGLGIANPAYLLHLQRHGNTEIVLNNTRGSSTGGIGQYDDRLELNSITNHPFVLRTNGVERLRVTNDGKVGIKTTHPNNTLTVGDSVQTSYAPASAGNYIEIARTSGADAGLLINKNTGQWLVGIDNSDGANAPLRFEYGAAGSAHPGFGSVNPAMMMKHNGNIGIGTDNPGAALHVLNSSYPTATIQRNHAVNYPRLRLINTSNHGADLDGIGDGSPAGGFRISTITGGTSTERVRITSNGVVQLSNGNLITAANTTSYIGITGGNSTANGANIWMYGGSHSTNPSAFLVRTGTTERFRITSAGDVGIGTDVPVTSSGYANLSLAKTNGGQLELKKLSSGRQHYIWGDDNLNVGAAYNGSGALIVKVNGNNERLRITSGGEVNIGGNYTQTSAPLCVTTDANDFGMRLMSGSNTVLDILNNDAAGNAEVRGYYNNNSGSRGEGFRLEASGNSFFNGGNFGIGTNGPSEKLHINGSNGVKLRIDCPNDYSNSSSIVMSQGRAEIKTTIDASGGNPGGTLVFRTRNTAGSLIDSLSIANTQGVTINSVNGTHALTVGDGGAVKFRVNSAGNIEMGGSFTAGATVHIRDSNNTTKGAAQLKISKGIGANAAPTSISRADCYIHLGSSEWGAGGSGIYLMGFGYTNGETGTGIPAYIGYRETTSSGYTYGDLIFGTRGNTTGTSNPTERLRIDSQGRLGVGVTPKGFHANNKDVIQGSSGYVILGRGTSSLNISQNFYYDSSDAGKYIVTGPATLYNQSNGSHTFYNASSGSADASASQVERFQIQSDGRISIGAPASNALGALHIHANQGTDTALWIGDSSTNRYLAINEQGSTQNFNHIHTRFNDNSIHTHYILENPYAAAAGYGSQIMFRGYNQETSAYLETSNEAANSARATFRIRGRDNHGLDVRSTGEITTTHPSNIGYNVSAATSSRGLVYASDSAQRMTTSAAQWYIVKSFYPEKSGTVAMQAQMYIKSGPYYFSFRVREEGTDTIVFNAGDNGGYATYENPSGQSGNVHNHITYKWICPLIKAHKRYYLEMAATNAAGTSVSASSNQYVEARFFRVFSDSPGTTAASDFIRIQQTLDISAATANSGSEYTYWSNSTNRDSLNSYQSFAGTESKFLGWYTIRAYNRYLDVEFNVGYGVMWFAQAYGYLYGRGQVTGSMISGYNYTNNQILNKFSYTAGNRGWYGSYRNGAGNLCLKFDSGSNGYSEGRIAIFLGATGPLDQNYRIIRYKQNDSTSDAF
jgi:hypothetical protein